LITGISIGNSSGNYKCLIHLDRLSITFRHWSGSTFHDIRNPDYIPSEQIFNNITLMYDNSPGPGAFYHSYKVYYKGYPVGRLHSATKLKKHELQFDFAKEVFYSFSSEFWHEIYNAIKSDLGIIFNNLMYLEISIDTDKNLLEPFGLCFSNCVNNNLRSGNRYKMRKSSIVHVMQNGTSFLLGCSENSIEIYNKTKHAEQFILDYFNNNGLAGKEVHRIEARLSWNYIRHLRNRRGLNIDAETLRDEKKLAKIFQESTKNKIIFDDTMFKTNDKHGNSHCKRISVVDDLPIATAEIGQLNQNLQINHYKNDSVDENIIRQNYFRYLESGNREYLRILKANVKVAGYAHIQFTEMIDKFNRKFMGNRTQNIIERMNYARKYVSSEPKFNFGQVFYAIGFKLKWHLMGLL
jgi:hypothetical protein